MKNYRYPAIFFPDEGAISVEFPDLPGCLTYGDNVDHAFEMAKEALGGWMASYLEERDAPPATPLQEVMRKLERGDYEDEDFKREPGAFVMLVEVEPVYLRQIQNKAVKVNTSIPGWLKAAAEKNEINISQVLQNALKKELNIH